MPVRGFLRSHCGRCSKDRPKMRSAGRSLRGCNNRGDWRKWGILLWEGDLPKSLTRPAASWRQSHHQMHVYKVVSHRSKIKEVCQAILAHNCAHRISSLDFRTTATLIIQSVVRRTTCNQANDGNTTNPLVLRNQQKQTHQITRKSGSWAALNPMIDYHGVFRCSRPRHIAHLSCC